MTIRLSSADIVSIRGKVTSLEETVAGRRLRKERLAMCLAKCAHSITRNAAITFFAAAAITCVAVAGVVAVVSARSAS